VTGPGWGWGPQRQSDERFAPVGLGVPSGRAMSAGAKSHKQSPGATLPGHWGRAACL